MSPGRRRARRRRGGEDTRLRIVEAALASLREEGYAGATARSIATRGGFNPALIFYHFGGVDELFLAALDHTSSLRLQRYEAALEGVNDLAQLIATLRVLYGEDADSAHVAAVQELVAASTFSSSMGKRIVELMTPWIALSERVIAGALAETPLSGLLPVEDLAFGMVALYMGLETMTRLSGGDIRRLDRLFATAESLATVLAPMLSHAQPGRRKPKAQHIPVE